MDRLNRVDKMIAVSREVRCTQLGIGPMSEACVLAAIDLATSLRIPIMVVASRRQIECEEQGGGYVHGWTTRTFAEYVRQRDPHGFVILCRDHGGPWQNNWEVEKKFSIRDAMESAKQSFLEDIQAGFQILHIDPSVALEGSPSDSEIWERIQELFLFCHREASRLGKKVYYELGKEEQGVEIETGENFSQFLQQVDSFVTKNHLPKPLFIVGQTGTKVVERRNIGSFERHFRAPGEIPPEIQVPKLVDACQRHGVFLKAHNVDYLGDEGIRWHTQLGIHAANVAPEFGVGETLQMVTIAEELGFHQEIEEFLSLAYESRKWEKWMLHDSQADDREKAVIAGHYVFATPAFQELKERLRRKCQGRNVDLDKCLKEKIKQLIYRYLINFNLVRSH